MLEFVISVIALVLMIIVIVFTDQLREIISNLTYYLKRLIKTQNGYTKINKLTENEPFLVGDGSRFIRDVTIPDGSKIEIGERFTKKWEIQNIGSVKWENRFLVRQGLSKGRGRFHGPERIRVPYTRAGERCIISVQLIAPDEPGSCTEDWKMVDEDGRLMFPNLTPLFISIDVIE